MQKLSRNKDILYEGSEVLWQTEDLALAYKDRLFDYREKTIGINEPIEQGWDEVKSNYKRKKLVRKDKTKDKAFEDNVWKMFYNAGFEILSSKPFKLKTKRIKISKKALIDNPELKKTHTEIDVLVKDGNNVFVIECKSKETYGKSAQIDSAINKITTKKKRVITAIRELFYDVDDKKLDIHFIIATEDIKWSSSQEAEAKENNLIKLMYEDTLYIEEVIAIAGKGTKYTLLNRLLYDKEMKNEYTITALEGKMGGQKYWMFGAQPEELLKYATVNYRTKESSFSNLKDSYQRRLIPAKVKKINEYILKENGFFPNSVIINFSREPKKIERIGNRAKYEEQGVNAALMPVRLTFPKYYGSAWVIDGQHRLYGYADTEKKYTETMPVVAIRMEDPVAQSKIFVDINENQKQIPPELKWDLYEELYANSTKETEIQKYMISRIGKHLCKSFKNGPFKNQIKVPMFGGGGHIGLHQICDVIDKAGFVKTNGCFRRGTIDDTIKFTAVRINQFYGEIAYHLEEEWRKKDKYFLNHNAGIKVLTNLLRDLTDGAIVTKDELENDKKFRKEISKYLSPLINHFKSKINEADVKTYKQANRGALANEVLLDFIRVIREVHPYKSLFHERHKKTVESQEIKITNQSLKIILNKLESEGDTLELKGAFRWDINSDLVKGKYQEYPSGAEEVRKSVVAFLNSRKHAQIIIGVLEKDTTPKNHKKSYQQLVEEKDLEHIVEGKCLVIGIGPEYSRQENQLDGYIRCLTDSINDNIEPEPHGIDIKCKPFMGIELCIISIKPDYDYWYYLKKGNDKIFYYRLGSQDKPLKGAAVDRYKEKMKNTN